MDSAVRAAGRVAWLVAEALIMGLEVWKAVEDTPSQAVVPSLFSKGQKAPPPQLPSDFQAVQYWTSLKSPNVLRPNLYCTMARNIQGTSRPSGPAMQPCAPKGQGSLFDKGCTRAEGFGAAQHEVAAAGSMHPRGKPAHGKPAPKEELMNPTATAPSLRGAQRQ
eukprot:624858-Pelagomonas_calceolata.AAC.3